jgi:hypothetical protein
VRPAVNTMRTREPSRLFRGTLLLLLHGILPATGGTITLETRVAVSKNEMAVELVLAIANRGDETARQVSPRGQLGGDPVLFEATDIGPGSKATFRATVQMTKLVDMSPGTYPVPLVIAYFDANSERHEVPAYGILRTTEVVPEMPFDVALPKGPIRASAHFDVVVRSHAKRPVVLRASVHSAPAIQAKPASITFRAEPQVDQLVSFTLECKGGEAEAVMPLFLFLELDLPTMHGTLVRGVPVMIQPIAGDPARQNTVRRNAVLALTTAIALVVAAAIATWRWQGRHRK